MVIRRDQAEGVAAPLRAAVMRVMSEDSMATSVPVPTPVPGSVWMSAKIR
jgi:hypothetical protein